MKEKKLFKVRLINNTLTVQIYVAAKNEEQAILKAKIHYPYMVQIGCEEFGKVIL